MNIHSMLEKFNALDIKAMKVRTNTDVGSVWITNELDIQSPVRLHVRVNSVYQVLRLYYISPEGEQHRLTYQGETDRLRMVTVTQNTLQPDEIVIENALSFESEEHMFQESLVKNMETYSYESLNILSKLFYETVGYAKELLDVK